MKKIHFAKHLTDYISRNRVKFFIAFISLFLGTVIGSLSALTLADESFEGLFAYLDNFVSAYTLQPTNRSIVFWNSLYNNIKILLFMWLSGLWAWLIPFGVAQLGIKGYKLSFTLTLLIQIYGMKGVVFAFTTLLPQFLFMLPILVFYVVFNINFSLELRRYRGRCASPEKDMYIKNLLTLFVVLVVMVLCSLFDGFVIPTVLRPICLFLN